MGKILLQTCGQIITRECQKNYFREEGRFLRRLFKGPKTPYHHYPFRIYTRGALGCLKEQTDPWAHGGHCLGSWTECPVTPAVWLCHKSSFSMGPLGKRLWVPRRKENSKDALYSRGAASGFGYSLQVPGEHCVSTAQRYVAESSGLGASMCRELPFFNKVALSLSSCFSSPTE